MDVAKTLFFGWDGVPPKVIMDGIGYGYLPNMKDLIDSGLFGVLKSELPIVTPANWYSALTGYKPFRHGVVNFAVVDRDYTLRYMSILDLKVDGIWSYLTRYGYEGLYVNIPISTPAPRVKGLWIAQEQEFVGPIKPKTYHIYPEDYLDKVDALGFLVGYPFYSGKPRIYAEKVRDVEEAKLKAFYDLLREDRYYLNLFIAMSPDILLHIFMDDEDYMDEVYKTLNMLDRWLGKFMDYLGENANYIIISDHGHSRKKGLVNILKILENLGYLYRAKRYRIRASWIRRSQLIRRLWGILPQRVKSRLSKEINKFILLDSPSRELIVNVDWERTKVFPLINVGGLKVNLKDRYKSGIVESDEINSIAEELTKKLRELNVDGETMFKDIEIHLNDDPYIPDILLELHRDYWFISSSEDREIIYFDLPKLTDDLDLKRYSTTVSNHIRDAFYVLSGKVFNKGDSNPTLRIVDMAPSILYLFDIPIPSDIDGTINKDLFKREFFEERRPKYTRYKGVKIKKRLVKVRRKVRKRRG